MYEHLEGIGNVTNVVKNIENTVKIRVFNYCDF